MREELASAKDERDAYRRLYQEALERCRKLELGLRGQSSEKLRNEAQLSFDMLKMMLAEDGQTDLSELEPVSSTVRSHTRTKPTGRKPLPDHLPRVDIEVLPDEVKREGLDAFERIGEEVTEVLERRPASLVVARIIKPTFVRKGRKRRNGDVLRGQTPEQPIPRGLAGPGMLADTLVRRWQDHQPLNRLESIYARDGVALARQTICDWHMELAPLCDPLIGAMREDAFVQPYLCVDATGVLVQHQERCRTGHFWVLIAPGKHVLFEYTPKHDGRAVDAILSGYEGYLVADAHAVYDHLYKAGDVIEVNCWAHCRRYFFKAMDSDPDRAKVALGLIGGLFKIERSLARSPKKKREKEQIRAKHSAPIVDRFFSWCDAEWPNLLEGTPIYDGIRYARNQRAGLVRFLDDGRLPIHNNESELNLRRQAVGRKNWLFVGSDDGGRTNAIFTSLLASCRMLDIEPWSYLRDILCLLPGWSTHQLLDLAPINWPTTSKREDVRAKLVANPYRQLTLLEP